MKKLKIAFSKLIKPTTTCKICFNDFDIKSFANLFNQKTCICNKCQKTLNPHFYKFKINNCNGVAIYDYDDTVKSLIYQFKGCSDIELKDIFLSPYSYLLKLLYFDYYLVYIPSLIEDDTSRGFNHVKEMFSILNLKHIDLLTKEGNYKQSDQDYKNRENICRYLKLKNNVKLKNKKILLVDDILTTGNTLYYSIELIKRLKPKKIKVLTIAKVKPLNDDYKHKYEQKNGFLQTFLNKIQEKINIKAIKNDK